MQAWACVFVPVVSWLWFYLQNLADVANVRFHRMTKIN
jgi:hypothetical protein